MVARWGLSLLLVATNLMHTGFVNSSVTVAARFLADCVWTTTTSLAATAFVAAARAVVSATTLWIHVSHCFLRGAASSVGAKGKAKPKKSIAKKKQKPRVSKA